MATRTSPLIDNLERGSALAQPGSEGWPQRYRIRGRLRRASGRPVLLAIDQIDGRLVVIKASAGGGDAQHEAQILAQLGHPNIVALRDRVERCGASYLVIDYVDARSLEDHLAGQGGRLQPAALTRLLLGLCDALSHVHTRGLLHRDLKPANVLVRAEGTPVLADFSAALPLDRGAEQRLCSFLTDGYAAPEQYADDQAEGPGTDVYGLGALAYRAFTGEVPRAAPERLRGHIMPPAAAQAGSDGAQLAAAIDWALALDPRARPQSVEEWRQALEGGTRQPGPAANLERVEEPDDVAPTVRLRRVRTRRLIAPADTAAEEAPAPRRRRIERVLLGALLLGVVTAAIAAGAFSLRPLYERYVKTNWVVDAAGGGDARAIGEALRRAGDHARLTIHPGIYPETVVIERPVHLVAALVDQPPVIAPPDGPCLVTAVRGGSVVGLNMRGGRTGASGAQPKACLVIAGGDLRVEDSAIAAVAGPAIQVRGGAEPELRGNVIASGTGAGAIISEGAGGMFAENRISDIEGPSLIIRSGARPKITQNVIENSGPAIFAEGAGGAFTRNRVVNGRASAIEISSGADPVLAGNMIEGAKQAGIFVYDHGRGRLEGNTLRKSGLSGVVVADGAASRISSNTIEASGEHGVLVLDGSRGVLERNTITGNAGHGIAVAPAAEVDLIDNQLGGNSDPQLLDARAKEGSREREA
jgi:parallel beta-helix repeat protein